MTKKLSSLQKIFNKAWKHFIVGDGKPGYGNGCRYRDDNGNRCAIGLMMDKETAADCEDVSFGLLINRYNSKIKSLFPDLVGNPKYDCETLDQFQRELHDGLIDDDGKWRLSKEERKKIYEGVAKEFGLTVPKPKVKKNTFEVELTKQEASLVKNMVKYRNNRTKMKKLYEKAIADL